MLLFVPNDFELDKTYRKLSNLFLAINQYIL